MQYCYAAASSLDVDSKLAINAKLKSVETTWFTSGAQQHDGNSVLLHTFQPMKIECGSQHYQAVLSLYFEYPRESIGTV